MLEHTLPDILTCGCGRQFKVGHWLQREDDRYRAASPATTATTITATANTTSTFTSDTVLLPYSLNNPNTTPAIHSSVKIGPGWHSHRRACQVEITDEGTLRCLKSLKSGGGGGGGGGGGAASNGSPPGTTKGKASKSPGDSFIDSDGNGDGDGDGGDGHDGSEGWACTACTFWNTESTFQCSICGTSAPTTKATARSRLNSSSSKPNATDTPTDDAMDARGSGDGAGSGRKIMWRTGLPSKSRFTGLAWIKKTQVRKWPLPVRSVYEGLV